MRFVASIAILCVVALTAPRAQADDKNVARQSFQEGNRLYDLADFSGALAAFKKAYLNYEEPSFLFNIAQCYRALGNSVDALRFYRTYLRKQPDAPNAGEVRRLIAAVEATRDRDAARVVTPPSARVEPTAPARVEPTPPAPRPVTVDLTPVVPQSNALQVDAAPARRPVYKKWWFWTVTVVGAAAVATGVGLGLTLGRPSETSFQVHTP